MTVRSDLKFTDAATFGTYLIVLGDLDPIYEMLRQARLNQAISDEETKRWCLAYWWFYNAGVAAAIASSPDFYRAALYAFDNKWERGAERRHFRTANARDSILWFQRMFPDPVGAVDYAIAEDRGERRFKDIQERVKEFPMFGAWITFKIADMADRCLDAEVDFSDCRLLEIYDEPRKAASIVAEQWNIADPWEAVRELSRRLSFLKAPPDFKRELRLQEIETVLCKYKSHLNGHYPIGKDRHEIRESLRHRFSPLGRSLLRALLETERDIRPQPVEWAGFHNSNPIEDFKKAFGDKFLRYFTEGKEVK